MRLNLASLMLLAFSLPLSGRAAELPDVDIPYEKFRLDNGLTVIVHEDRKAPIVAVSVWYRVGSMDEPEGKTGFAHLFEHLMFNGSENYNHEYFEPFEQVGTTNQNGTTWFDRTNYFQDVPTPALEMALWLESDRMGHLLGAVDQAKLDNQRSVVQNEKRQSDNQPYGLVEYRVLEGLFPAGHPYRHSAIGSMADLNAASLEDVHQWFKDYYGAANAVLVLAGDIDAASARPLVEKYFGDIPSGPPIKRMQAWVPERSQSTFEVMYDRVPQIRSYRYWAVPGRTTRERFELELAASVLGTGKNSRLYQSLVYQEQLAVELNVYVEEHLLASSFVIDVTLQPGASLERVNQLIDQELAQFLASGPTEEELERARTRTHAALVRGLEQVGGFSGKATLLAEGELYAGDPGFFQRGLAWFKAAKPADVTRTAKAWLADGRYQLDVLPFGDYATVPSAVDRSTGLPPVGDMPALSFPEIQRGQLRNGLQVVLAERRTLPVVNVSMHFDAGYAADAGGKLGASGFAMAMLDEGTLKRSALEISAEAERLGAELATDSNMDMSSVSLSALTTTLKPSLALLADVIRNPAFSEEEIGRLRQRWLAAIEQEKSDPVSLALRTLPPILYGQGHAYGIPLTGSGTTESITGLTREDLVQFHRSWIRPSNGTLFVVGDTSLAEILPLLEEQFGNWPEPQGTTPAKNLAEVSLPEAGRVIIIDKPGAPQSMILAGHLAPPTGVAENLAIETMNDILGGQFTARANMNLREDKGWAYGAYTLLPSARGQRSWIVYAPVQTDRTADSIRELRREFDEYLDQRPATPEELQKSVRNAVNSLPGQFETAASVLNSLASNQRFGRPDDYVPGLPARYAQLDLEQIQGAAEQALAPKSLTWLIVGDRAKIEAELGALGLGPVSAMDADGKPVE